MVLMRTQKIFFIVLCLLCCLVGNIGAEGAVRLGIVKFVSKTNDVTEEQTAAITDTLTRLLRSSRGIEIIDREQMNEIGRKNRLNVSSNIIDARRMTEWGLLAGVQYMVVGAITEVSFKFKTTPRERGTDHQYDGSVILDTRVIDVATGQVVLSVAKSGYADFSYEVRGSSLKHAKKSMEENRKGRQDVFDRAASFAARRIADEIYEYLVR